MPLLANMLVMGAAAAVLAAPTAAVVVKLKPDWLQRALRKYRVEGQLREPSDARGPRAAWKNLSQPEGVPKVTYGRSYVFMTHHKTGTNLMQQLCNYTARILTGGKDECAFCLRVQPPDKSGYLQCVPDPQAPHGRLRGTFNRFTLVSSINGNEFELVRTHAPDFRAIHMIREPTKMTISAYQYAKFVNSDNGKTWRWDTLQDVSKEKTIDDQLRAEARAMQNFLNEMLGVHKKCKVDDRVLELDLEAFEANYEDAARRMWLHLLEDVSETEMQTWLKWAVYQDKNRWDQKAKAGSATVAPSLFVSGEEAKQAWQRLEEAGDEAVLSVRAFSKPMGYNVTGKP